MKQENYTRAEKKQMKRDEAAERQAHYDSLSFDEKMKKAGKKEQMKLLARKESNE